MTASPSTTGNPYKLFISHKHTDAAIARAIADFIRKYTLGKVTIHVSSDPKYSRPKIGANLNSELHKALWEADALILVYTSTDQDWSYCMWECGVATEANSTDTNVYVFQCAGDVPKPFEDQVRVNVRKLDQLRSFTDLFFSGPFFAGKPAIADFTKQDTDDAAKVLYDELKKVLPMDDVTEEWPTWPYMCVEIPCEEVDRIVAAPAHEQLQVTGEIARDHAIITRWDARAPLLFGMASFPKAPRLRDLATKPKDTASDSPPEWFESFCEQIMMAVKRNFLVIRPSYIKETGGDAEYTPLLSVVRRLPFQNKFQFDFHFINLSDPRSIPAVSRMLKRENIVCKRLGTVKAEQLKLAGLRKEFQDAGKYRMIFLTDADHPLFVIHRSVVEQFMLDASKPTAELTLADLLNDPGLKQLVETSFATIGKRATLAEANAKMKDMCRDVFITADGKKDEPILGWITNVDLVG